LGPLVVDAHVGASGQNCDVSDGWDDTVGAGMRNRELMTLAQHHCTQMEFVADGGQGMAEAATGLPINPRGVRCPIAHGGMRSTNLEPIVLAFYRENCVGCEQRRPTGVVPNLASYVDESDALAAAAAAREDERRATLHRDWQERQEHRRAMMAQCDEPVVGVLRDIGSLDVDPGAESSQNDQDPALSRLKALGERAPATFTTDVVAHSVEMDYLPIPAAERSSTGGHRRSCSIRSGSSQQRGRSSRPRSCALRWR
jgi:hypothetical protein